MNPPKKEAVIYTHPLTGESLTATQWAQKLGVSVSTFRSRIHRSRFLKLLAEGKESQVVDYVFRPGKLSAGCESYTFTHPVTGETYTAAQWGEKLGIKSVTFHKRIQKVGYPISRDDSSAIAHVFSPSHRESRAVWTREEDDYLCRVWNFPNLYHHWIKKAEREGWSKHSYRTLKNRIKWLRRNGYIQRAVSTDGTEPIITLTSLARCLDVSYDVVYGFVTKGLPIISRPCKDKDISTYQVYMRDFVDWCLGQGIVHVSKSLSGNSLALYWLLGQIAVWHKDGYVRPSPGRRSKSCD